MGLSKGKEHTTDVSMDGRVCIVTGANSGVGFEAALRLAQGNAHLVMVCRNRQRGEEAKAKIEASVKGPVDLLLADLSSLAEVRRLGKELLDRYPKIHILVNNAGMHSTRRTVTVDGFETTFAINHLAPFLLTHLLLERLKASAPARIVNVNSKGHRFGGLNLHDLHWEKRHYFGIRAYGASKTANLMFTRELADKLKGTRVTINAMHPGEVKSRMGSNNGWLWRKVYKALLVDPLLKPASISGDAIYYLAASPELDGVSGKYFNLTQLEKPFPHALNRSVGHIVWLLSEQFTGLVTRDTSLT
ncbi:MAG: SDR family NAD(P)-dependent oxidoreductase [Deltaproteobacteria bacterium]|nr:MAG: SDR family NAD(P)-dependent oxidoreductase [Deltaproteobacteria bacterium]